MAIILIIAIAFLLNNLAYQKTLVKYRETLQECLQSIKDYNSGYTDVYGRQLVNVSFNATTGYWIGEIP